MIISNPYLKEQEKTFEILASSTNSKPITLDSNPINPWNFYSDIFNQYKIDKLDISNEAHCDQFELLYWVYFGIADNTSINAFAWSDKDHKQYINLNSGLIYYIHDIFLRLMSLQDIFPKIGNNSNETHSISDFHKYFFDLKKDWKTFEQIPNCPIRKQAANLMTGVAIDFAFNHELGHLIECHTHYHREFHKLDEYHEFSLAKMSKAQCEDKRCFEFAADHYGIKYSYNIMMKVTGFEIFNPYHKDKIWQYSIYVLLRILNPLATHTPNGKGTHPSLFLRYYNLLNECANILEEKRSIKNPMKYSLSLMEETMEFFEPIWFFSVKDEDLESSLEEYHGYIEKMNFLNRNKVAPIKEKRHKHILHELELMKTQYNKA